MDIDMMVLRSLEREKEISFEVLVEGLSKRNARRLMGRTGTNKVVVFDPNGNVKPGDLVEIAIERSTSMTLFGKLSSEENRYSDQRG